MEKHSSKPQFVSKELYFSTNLTFTEVHIKCRELGLKKMLDISDETIQSWYVEFLREKWSSAKFNERISEMRNLKTYGGRIDISAWFEREAIYTPAQVAVLIERQITNILIRANHILEGKTIEVEYTPEINLNEIKFLISKTVNTYYDSELKEKADEAFEELLPAVLEKLGLKRNIQDQKVGIGTKMKRRFKF
jgi:hypothetical protein